MASIDDLKAMSQRPDRPPRDEEIRASKVYMVRSSDQRLSEPIPTHEILESRERDDKGRPTQFLQEVAGLDVAEGRFYPICRMFDKKAARESELAKRKAGKVNKLVMKQLQCSWTMSDNDLGHRLGRLKEFLEKGWRVEILFGTKRKGWMDKRRASAEEVTSVLSKIRAAVGEVDGAKEMRNMQGKEGGEAILSFEGKSKK